MSSQLYCFTKSHSIDNFQLTDDYSDALSIRFQPKLSLLKASNENSESTADSMNRAPQIDHVQSRHQFPLSDQTGASALPPVWVDTAEEVEDMLL